MNIAVNVGKCEREQVIKKRNMKLSKRVRISKLIWNLKENMYCIRIIQIVVVYQTLRGVSCFTKTTSGNVRHAEKLGCVLSTTTQWPME